MRILADTNLFVKFCRRLPLPPPVLSAFEAEQNELCLASISVMEIYRLWQVGKLPANPDSWLDLALPGWTVIPMTAPIARQAVLWNWEHRDPADRIIAATAAQEKIQLWHTDTVLKNITGFPHKFFKNVLE
ncbi:MAG TPA: PIN domain-containing protein [Candidatus Paceibacterota bacterium]|nr:PIN domain-containing protein [Candidatus Paceibacterota bacterium]